MKGENVATVQDDQALVRAAHQKLVRLYLRGLELEHHASPAEKAIAATTIREVAEAMAEVRARLVPLGEGWALFSATVPPVKVSVLWQMNCGTHVDVRAVDSNGMEMFYTLGQNFFWDLAEAKKVNG